MPIPACKDFPGRLGGRDHLDPMAMKVAKQSTVEYSDLGQTSKRPRSSTAHRCVMNHLDPVWLLHSGPWQEGEVGEVQPSLTIIQVSCNSKLQLSHIIHSNSYDNGQVSKW